MEFRLKLAGIEPESIVDGPGIRYTIFTQGCNHNCKGCHNPETHDISQGYWANKDEILQDLKENPLLKGVTFSGGEPFMQPEPLYELAKEIKDLGLDLIIYTGYTLEKLLEMGKSDKNILGLLRLTDTLIDGPYMEEKRDLELEFRGSSNQRILDMKALNVKTEHAQS